MTQGCLRTIEPLPDVRIFRRGSYIYICSSRSTLRLPANAAVTGPKSAPSIPDEPIGSNLAEYFGSDVTNELVRRGLAAENVAAKENGSAVAASAVVRATGVYQVVGSDSFTALIVHILHRFGKTVVQRHKRPTLRETSIIVLPLSMPDDELREWTAFAIDRRVGLVVYLCSQARMLMGALRPPTTACPVCLATRMRATFGWQDIADSPLDVLFGEARDNRWPGVSAAAALVAQAAVGGVTDEAVSRPVLNDLNIESMSVRKHPLVHTPNCPACANHVKLPGIPLKEWFHCSDEPSLTECWERMQRGIDPLTGVTAGIAPTDRPEAAGGLTHMATTGHVETRWFSEVSAQALGGAVKFDQQHASVCALGEAMERYACGVYRPNSLLRSTLHELGDRAVDPRSLPLGLESEYAALGNRVRPYTDDLEIEWAEGVSLQTGDARYVPACAVYVPYRFPRPDEILLRPISTGLAAGPTPAAAIRAGLLEAIERDSLVICWDNRLELPTLDLDTLPPSPARDIVTRLHDANVEIICKDTTTDIGVPTVLLSSRQRLPSGDLLVAHAARAALSELACIQAALEELEQSREAVRSWLAEHGVPPSGARLRTMEDFFCYYCAEDRLSALDFLYAGEIRSIDPNHGLAYVDPVSSVDTIVKRLSSAGLEAIAIDITSVDVAECGVRVIKSIAPGLQPFAFSQDFRHRGGQRLYQAPVRMGIYDTPLRPEELNPYPVPPG